MDFLQIALIFLILLLSVFLAVTGIQVFFILRDLKKALDNFSKMLESGGNIAADIERPIKATSSLMTKIAQGAKALTGIDQKQSRPKPKRFYKKIL